MQKIKKFIPTQKTTMIKGILLYLLPSPIIITLFFALLKGDIKAIIFNAISLFILLSAASIARVGFLAQREYEKNTLSFAPKYPYKTISAVVLGIGVFFSSYFTTENSLLLSIVLAICAFGGFYLYYGFDPRDDKVKNLSTGVSAKEIIDITNQAKSRVENLQKLSHQMLHDTIKEKLDIIIKETNHTIDIVQNDPTTLSKARKFFNIYLDRSEKITTEYVKNLKNNNIDDKMQEDYINLLTNLESALQKQKERLNKKELTMLDVQIEVLSKQLKNEGAR